MKCVFDVLSGSEGVRVSKVTEANLSLSTSGGNVDLGSIRAHDASISTRGGAVKVGGSRGQQYRAIISNKFIFRG